MVRNNLIAENDKAGLLFGGVDQSRGRVDRCTFVNNVIYKNDTLGGRFGQLAINFGSNDRVANNIFVASSDGVMVQGVHGNTNVRLDHNLWFSDAGAASMVFTLEGRTFVGFDVYRIRSHQDGHSLFGDPLFVNPAALDFHLHPGSSAVDTGSLAPRDFAPVDFDGQPRPQGPAPDIGAFEGVRVVR
jgi:hypothetical protein